MNEGESRNSVSDIKQLRSLLHTGTVGVSERPTKDERGPEADNRNNPRDRTDACQQVADAGQGHARLYI